MNILKYINSLPVSLTLRHYQVFGEATASMKERTLTSAESWDALRQEHEFFSIAETRDEWLRASEVLVKKDGQDSRLRERAEGIAKLLSEKHIDRIFSVGCGGAALEYQIKKLLPDLRLACSDYAPVTVERLKKVFIESDEIIQFDVLAGDWSEADKKFMGERGACLMYRIDAGFTDEEWKVIFNKLAAAGVRHILYIPTGTLSILSIYNRKKRELLWALRGVQKVFSGYLRTKARFKEFWEPLYVSEELELGGLKSFWLRR